MGTALSETLTWQQKQEANHPNTQSLGGQPGWTPPFKAVPLRKVLSCDCIMYRFVIIANDH